MAVILKRTAELLPLVLPYAPECPDFIAEHMIRFAAIEFAERSRAWRHVAEVDLDDNSITALLNGTMETTDYGLLFAIGGQVFRAAGTLRAIEADMEAPTVAVIHEIEFAEFEGSPLTPVQFSAIGPESQGKPRYISQVQPNAITLWPFKSGRLLLSMFLKPSSATLFGTVEGDPLADKFNVIPDFFASQHGQTLAMGALSRILSMPGEPWTNEAKAAQYEMRFQEKLNGSFRTNMRGQQRAPIRTKYRDF